jgi:hypothetical protein
MAAVVALVESPEAETPAVTLPVELVVRESS